MVHTFCNQELDSVNIKINNNCLENMKQAKYLGVILDPKLKYNNHIDAPRTFRPLGFFVHKYMSNLFKMGG